jgi:predicted metal-binding membrane protein
MPSERISQPAFLAVCGLLFGVSAAVTVVCGTSMSATGGMMMPGGWTMSMAWMRMPGQTWLGIAGSFVGMWVVMMIAMMLPSITPVLWSFRQVISWMPQKRIDYLITSIAAGYFFVWTILGIVVFAGGATLSFLEMHRPSLASAAPYVGPVAILIAGIVQFTPWKTRHLACCRELSRNDSAALSDARRAWREGLHLGVHCSLCCAGFIAVLLVGGIMNLAVMAVVSAGITL